MSQEFAKQVIRKLLRPAVRLSLRYGVQLNELIELIKSVLVEVSRASIAGEAGADALVSASRVSAMTGVHRKDIVRLMTTDKPSPTAVSLIARIMAQWQHGRAYVTKAGKPRVLDCEGKDSEFAKLVASVNGGDVSGYAVMFEMERRGIIERAHGKVKLVWRDYAPSDSIKEQLDQWGDDTVDLGSAVESNLFHNQKLNHHHLRTAFDNIPQSHLYEIRTWLMSEGSAFHRRVRQYLSSFDKDISPETKGSGGKARVIFGSFSMSTLENEETANQE